MMTYYNHESNKSISISVSDEIASKVVDSYNVKYAPILPKVICADKEHARIIQEKVNEFVNKLSHEMIK